MNGRLTRFQKSTALHFVTLLCAGGQKHLETSEARDIFERSLETMRDRYRFVVAGYAVLPEHVHLLIGEPKWATLGTALQALKLSVARQRIQRPFWETLNEDTPLQLGTTQTEMLREIHLDPVRHGMAETPDGWAWSSARHWERGEMRAVRIASHWTDKRAAQAVEHHRDVG